MHEISFEAIFFILMMAKNITMFLARDDPLHLIFNSIEKSLKYMNNNPMETLTCPELGRSKSFKDAFIFGSWKRKNMGQNFKKTRDAVESISTEDERKFVLIAKFKKFQSNSFLQM